MKSVVQQYLPVVLAIVMLVGVSYLEYAPERPPSAPAQSGRNETAASDALGDAFRNRASGVQVQGAGVVTRILPDDTEGSRHQRFIVRLPSSQTVLVSHNIDLALRIEGLAGGDDVSFRGEYEWNEKGGVVHWTHHDPKGRRVGGWIRHDGKTYR